LTNKTGEFVLLEELSSGEFKTGIAKSKDVCVLPIGIPEKQGYHLPPGTDMRIVNAVKADKVSLKLVNEFNRQAQ